MRIHTKEIEKYDMYRTELEITERTCQEIINAKARLDNDMDAQVKNDKIQYSLIFDMMKKAMNTFDRQFQILVMFADKTCTLLSLAHHTYPNLIMFVFSSYYTKTQNLLSHTFSYS